jgi:hypothetical protein
VKLDGLGLSTKRTRLDIRLSLRARGQSGGETGHAPPYLATFNLEFQEQMISRNSTTMKTASQGGIPTREGLGPSKEDPIAQYI